MAGSIFIAFRMPGRRAPASAATTRLMTSATAMIIPSQGSLKNQEAATATTAAHRTPFSVPTATSRRVSQARFRENRSSWAMLLITRVSVWLPATPPMLATMGMRTASATTFSMVSVKRSITEAAMNAVSRLAPSHTALCLAVCRMGAKVS